MTGIDAYFAGMAADAAGHVDRPETGQSYDALREREDRAWRAYQDVRRALEQHVTSKWVPDALDVITRGDDPKAVQRARQKLLKAGAPPATVVALDDCAHRWRAAGMASAGMLAQIGVEPGTGSSEGLAGMAALRREMQILANRLNPAVSADFVSEIWGEGPALQASGAAAGVQKMRVAGAYTRAKALVQVALDPARFDPVDTTCHEVWHSLEQLLTPTEQKALAAELPAKDTRSTRKDLISALEAGGYSDPGSIANRIMGKRGQYVQRDALTIMLRKELGPSADAVIARLPDRSALVHRERMAYAFGQWAAERHRGEDSSTLRSPAQKMGTFLIRLGNWMDGEGFQTAEDIFEKAWKGDLGKRAVRLAKKDPAAYRRLMFLEGDDPEFKQMFGGEPVAGMASADTSVTRGKDQFSLSDGSALDVKYPDYRIVQPELLGAGSTEGRLQQFQNALDTLEALEISDQKPNAADAARLAAYPGVGSLPRLFIPHSQQPAGYRIAASRLREMLGESGVSQVRASSTNAHYTDHRVVQAVWDALGRAGLAEDAQARVLEPGAGAGWWIGLRPDWLPANRIWPVEIEPVAQKIIAQLYPSANLLANGFERVDLPEGFFTAAVGNVPYGDFKVHEPGYAGLSIHNHFLKKSVDLVAPGGIVALLTSRYTLDQQDPSFRESLRDGAELLTAVRLPEGALGRAGTDVVADLLVLRKRPTPLTALDGQERSRVLASERDWVGLAEIADPLGGAPMQVNRFFAEQPQNVIGRLERSDSMFPAQGDQKGITVSYPFGGEQMRSAMAEQLSAILERELPAGSYRVQATDRTGLAERAAMHGQGLQTGRYHIVDNVLFQRDGAGTSEPCQKPAKAQALIRDAIGLDDAFKATLAAQRASDPMEDRETARQRLKTVYDQFVATHGELRSRPVARLLATDPALSQLAGLERPGRNGLLADVFYKDVLLPAEPLVASTLSDAVQISVAQKGGIELPYMAQLLGRQSEDRVERELLAAGLAYVDPVSRTLVEADQYLSGDVRTKLAVALAAAEADEIFQQNVGALTAVLPSAIEPADIVTVMGAPWQDVETIREFIVDQVGQRIADRITVAYVPADGSWRLAADAAAKKSPEMASLGTAELDGLSALTHALNGKSPAIWQTVNDKRELDIQATQDAKVAVQKLDAAFKGWIWSDDTRSERLAARYNEMFNRWVEPRQGGAYLTLPGAAPERVVRLRSNQRNVIHRSLRDQVCGLFHEVGAGKTDSFIASAMEAKRLGLATKPLLSVKPSTLQQVIEDARTFYPGARILGWPDGTVTPATRREFWGTVQASDWDLVIVPHDASDALPLSPALESRFLQKEADAWREALEAIEEENDKGPRRTQIVKQLEKKVARLTDKVTQLLDKGRADSAVYFDDLGVDWFGYDEAHRLKNLYAPTALEDVRGLPSGESQRASRVYMQTRHVLANGGKWIPGTGTPVSNSLVEAFTWQRFNQAEMLEKAGINSFDAWVKVFGKVETNPEIDVTGQARMVTRLASYTNVPELQRMLRQNCDFVLAEDIPGLKRPKAHTQLVLVDASQEQLDKMTELARRASAIRSGRVKPWDDNMLAVATEGRKLALDPRLVIPGAAEGGKIRDLAVAAAAIRRDNPGTSQLVFFDMGVNPTKEAPDFSLRDAVRDAFVAAGIKPEEIVDFWALKDQGPEAVEAGKQALRDGVAAIGMGSTEILGTGVNVQNRLIAIHQLDGPWLPSHVAQRDGRGHRAGNLNSDVYLYRYATKNTFDAFNWQLLATKGRFNNQFMRGDAVSRTVAGDIEAAVTPAVIAALAAGNPLMLEHAREQQQVEKLEAEMNAGSRRRASLLEQARAADGQAATLRQEAQDAQGLSQRASSALASGIQIEMLTDAGRIVTDKEAGAVLRGWVVAEKRTSADMAQNNPFAGRPEQVVGRIIGADGKPAFELVFPRRASGLEGPAPLQLRPAGASVNAPSVRIAVPGSPALAIAALRAQLEGLAGRPAQLLEASSQSTSRADQLRQRAEAAATRDVAVALEAARTRLAQLEQRLKLPEPPPQRKERMSDLDISDERLTAQLSAALQRAALAPEDQALQQEAAIWSKLEADRLSAVQAIDGVSLARLELPIGVDLRNEARDEVAPALPQGPGQATMDQSFKRLLAGEALEGLTSSHVYELATSVDVPGDRLLVLGGNGPAFSMKLVAAPRPGTMNGPDPRRPTKQPALIRAEILGCDLREVQARRIGPFLLHQTPLADGGISSEFTLTHAGTGTRICSLSSARHGTMLAQLLEELPVDWAQLTPGTSGQNVAGRPLSDWTAAAALAARKAIRRGGSFEADAFISEVEAALQPGKADTAAISQFSLTSSGAGGRSHDDAMPAGLVRMSAEPGLHLGSLVASPELTREAGALALALAGDNDLPRGILISGPSGTGKTLMMRVLASETEIPILATSGTKLQSQYIGGTAERIHEMFRYARSQAERHGVAVLFIDEIDALGSRDDHEQGGGKRSGREMVNAFLDELDGASSRSGAPLLVIGATNRPEDLDGALKRPGRFDLKIETRLPDGPGREQIMLHHLGDEVDEATRGHAAGLARAAVGASPAELDAVVREARRLNGGVAPIIEDLDAATARVRPGAPALPADRQSVIDLMVRMMPAHQGKAPSLEGRTAASRLARKAVLAGIEGTGPAEPVVLEGPLSEKTRRAIELAVGSLMTDALKAREESVEGSGVQYAAYPFGGAGPQTKRSNIGAGTHRTDHGRSEGNVPGRDNVIDMFMGFMERHERRQREITAAQKLGIIGGHVGDEALAERVGKDMEAALRGTGSVRSAFERVLEWTSRTAGVEPGEAFRAYADFHSRAIEDQTWPIGSQAWGASKSAYWDSVTRIAGDDPERQARVGMGLSSLRDVATAMMMVPTETRDILGPVARDLGLLNEDDASKVGTPAVHRILVEQTLTPEGVKEAVDRNGFIRVGDPWARAGDFGLLAADRIREIGIDPTRHLLVDAIVQDELLGRLAHIQLAGNRVPATISIENSQGQVTTLVPTPQLLRVPGLLSNSEAAQAVFNAQAQADAMFAPAHDRAPTGGAARERAQYSVGSDIVHSILSKSVGGARRGELQRALEREALGDQARALADAAPPAMLREGLALLDDMATSGLSNLPFSIGIAGRQPFATASGIYGTLHDIAHGRGQHARLRRQAGSLAQNAPIMFPGDSQAIARDLAEMVDAHAEHAAVLSRGGVVPAQRLVDQLAVAVEALTVPNRFYREDDGKPVGGIGLLAAAHYAGSRDAAADEIGRIAGIAVARAGDPRRLPGDQMLAMEGFSISELLAERLAGLGGADQGWAREGLAAVERGQLSRAAEIYFDNQGTGAQSRERAQYSTGTLSRSPAVLAGTGDWTGALALAEEQRGKAFNPREQAYLMAPVIVHDTPWAAQVERMLEDTPLATALFQNRLDAVNSGLPPMPALGRQRLSRVASTDPVTDAERFLAYWPMQLSGEVTPGIAAECVRSAGMSLRSAGTVLGPELGKPLLDKAAILLADGALANRDNSAIRARMDRAIGLARAGLDGQRGIFQSRPTSSRQRIVLDQFSLGSQTKTSQSTINAPPLDLDYRMMVGGGSKAKDTARRLASRHGGQAEPVRDPAMVGAWMIRFPNAAAQQNALDEKLVPPLWRSAWAESAGLVISKSGFALGRLRDADTPRPSLFKMESGRDGRHVWRALVRRDLSRGSAWPAGPGVYLVDRSGNDGRSGKLVSIGSDGVIQPGQIVPASEAVQMSLGDLMRLDEQLLASDPREAFAKLERQRSAFSERLPEVQNFNAYASVIRQVTDASGELRMRGWQPGDVAVMQAGSLAKSPGFILPGLPIAIVATGLPIDEGRTRFDGSMPPVPPARFAKAAPEDVSWNLVHLGSGLVVARQSTSGDFRMPEMAARAADAVSRVVDWNALPDLAGEKASVREQIMARTILAMDPLLKEDADLHTDFMLAHASEDSLRARGFDALSEPAWLPGDPLDIHIDRRADTLYVYDDDEFARYETGEGGAVPVLLRSDPGGMAVISTSPERWSPLVRGLIDEIWSAHAADFQWMISVDEREMLGYHDLEYIGDQLLERLARHKDLEAKWFDRLRIDPSEDVDAESFAENLGNALDDLILDLVKAEFGVEQFRNMVSYGEWHVLGGDYSGDALTLVLDTLQDAGYRSVRYVADLDGTTATAVFDPYLIEPDWLRLPKEIAEAQKAKADRDARRQTFEQTRGAETVARMQARVRDEISTFNLEALSKDGFDTRKPLWTAVPSAGTPELGKTYDERYGGAMLFSRAAEAVRSAPVGWESVPLYHRSKTVMDLSEINHRGGIDQLQPDVREAMRAAAVSFTGSPQGGEGANLTAFMRTVLDPINAGDEPFQLFVKQLSMVRDKTGREPDLVRLPGDRHLILDVPYEFGRSRLRVAWDWRDASGWRRQYGTDNSGAAITTDANGRLSLGLARAMADQGLQVPQAAQIAGMREGATGSINLARIGPVDDLFRLPGRDGGPAIAASALDRKVEVEALVRAFAPGAPLIWQTTDAGLSGTLSTDGAKFWRAYDADAVLISQGAPGIGQLVEVGDFAELTLDARDLARLGALPTGRHVVAEAMADGALQLRVKDGDRSDIHTLEPGSDVATYLKVYASAPSPSAAATEMVDPRTTEILSALDRLRLAQAGAARYEIVAIRLDSGGLLLGAEDATRHQTSLAAAGERVELDGRLRGVIIDPDDAAKVAANLDARGYRLAVANGAGRETVMPTSRHTPPDRTDTPTTTAPTGTARPAQDQTGQKVGPSAYPVRADEGLSEHYSQTSPSIVQVRDNPVSAGQAAGAAVGADSIVTPVVTTVTTAAPVRAEADRAIPIAPVSDQGSGNPGRLPQFNYSPSMGGHARPLPAHSSVADTGLPWGGFTMPELNDAAGQDGELLLRLSDLVDQLNAGGDVVAVARKSGLLNDHLWQEMPDDSARQRVLPLLPGYVAFQGAGGWQTASVSNFIAAAGPDGNLAGFVSPKALDRLADYAGHHVEAVDRDFPDRVEKLCKDIVGLVRTINPYVEVHPAKRLYGVQDIVLGSNPAQGQGRKPLMGLYFDTHAAIAISTDVSMGDPLATGYHEAYHSIEALLSPREKAVIEKKFGAANADGFNEQAAEAFGKMAADRFHARRAGVKPPGTGLFANLVDFAERFQNLVEGHGFESWERVTERVLSGAVSQRAKVFDVTQPVKASDAARIAEAAGLDKLAQQYRDLGAYDSSLLARSARSARMLFGRKEPVKPDPKLTGDALYRNLRRYLPDSAIRQAVKKAGYDVIKDSARMTQLLGDRDAQLSAELIGSSAATPVHASGDTRGAAAAQDLVAARGGSPGPARAVADARNRNAWEIRAADFVNSIKLGEVTDTVRDGYQTRQVKFYVWPPQADARYRVPADQVRNTRDAALAIHGMVVRDALAQGRVVPPEIAQDHPNLAAQIQRSVEMRVTGGAIRADAGQTPIYAPGVPGLASSRIVTARAAEPAANNGPPISTPAARPVYPMMEAARTGSLADLEAGFAQQLRAQAGADTQPYPVSSGVAQQRLHAAAASGRLDKLYIDVPPEDRRMAVAAGASVDARTGLLYVPEDQPSEVRSRLLQVWPDWHTAVTLRDYRAVEVPHGRDAAVTGLSFDPLLHAWYIPPNARPDVMDRARALFPPLDRTAATPADRLMATRAGALYSLGLTALAGQGLTTSGLGVPAQVPNSSPNPNSMPAAKTQPFMVRGAGGEALSAAKQEALAMSPAERSARMAINKALLANPTGQSLETVRAVQTGSQLLADVGNLQSPSNQAAEATKPARPARPTGRQGQGM